MNPLLSMLTGNGGGCMPLIMKAVGAAMRGETPEAFMRQLAQTSPQLKGLDLSDLEGTARSLAQQKGADIGQLTNEAKAAIGKFM